MSPLGWGGRCLYLQETVKASLHCPMSSTTDSGWRTIGPFCSLMAKYDIQPMGPFYCRKRLLDSFQRTSSYFIQAKLHSTVQKARMGRSQESPPKEGSGGNHTGISWLLFKDITCPQKEWKNEANNRSFTLNKFVLIQCFKMEIQKKVKNAILQNNWHFPWI